MLYSEFIEGTKCKDNEHNYNVYKNLEVMYMNSNMTKNEIYEYGVKLVDNSKSEKEIMFEEKIKAEIEEEKEYVNYYEERAKFYLLIMDDKKQSNYLKKLAKKHKQRIKELKYCLV